MKPIRNYNEQQSKKKIYRVVTQKGIIECTEDHSLFRKHTLEQVKPSELIPGDEVLHRYIQNETNQ